MFRYMIANYALLTAFLFFFNYLFRRYLVDRTPSLGIKLLIGGLHGICALLLLVFTVRVNEVTFLDFRHIIVICAAYYGGLPASLVTALFVVFGRITFFGPFTPSHTSILPLISIVLAGVGSGLIMQSIQVYKRKWLLAVAWSMTLILVVTYTRGFRPESFYYIALVGSGGLFASVLIRSFLTNNQLIRQVEHSERQYRSLHSLQEAIFQSAVGTSMVVTDCRGRITHANKGTEHMLGYSAEELIGRDAIQIYHDSMEVEAYAGELSRKLGINIPTEQLLTYSADAEHYEGREWTFIRKDGARMTVLLTVTPLLLDGEKAGVIGIAIDITERKKMEAQLKQLSLLDGLTGIGNRRFFDEMLQQAWTRAVRAQEPDGLSLLMFDVDGFKAYNDHYGHQAGDECLRSITAIAKAGLNHPEAIFARYGGEEFAVILPGADASRAASMAEALRQSIERAALPHLHSVTVPVVTVSVGVSTYEPALVSSSEELVAMADRALYEAKANGRNQVMSYDSAGEAIFEHRQV